MEQKRTRRTFDPSFKHHAAQRVVEGKEKAAAVAADLGINIVSLYNWVKDYEKTKATAIANAVAQTTSAAETQLVPKAIPPSFTLGQEIFNSMAGI